eukprot:312735_1
MSSRALRRLRGNRVFDIAQQLGLDKSSDEEEEEDDYESDRVSSPSPTNNVANEHNPSPPSQPNEPTEEDEALKKKRKKNKKKNKKKKQKKKAAQIAKNAKKPSNKKQNKSNKSKPKNKSQKPKNPPSISPPNEEKKENDIAPLSDDICGDWRLLHRDGRYFDPNFEMKRKFGAIALEANNESNIEPSQKPRKNTKQHRMMKAKQDQLQQKFGHLTKRRVSLIKFHSTKWPKPYLHYARKTGNIYMELLREDKAKNIKYFEFKYDNDYNMVQMEYKQRCARYDPSEISFLIQQHPYHVDTCLTLSDILIKHGQLEEASDLVERALYRLESGLHSRFSWMTAECRLDYGLVSNRSFFLCLWKYSQTLGRRGCVHAAFELTKCLLSLSPVRDPLCSLLCLDYWALRAHEYQWVLDFAQSFRIEIFKEQMDALRMYPSWCYSVAFAKYQLELQQSFQGKKQSTFGECDDGRIPMDLGAVDGLSASVLMQQALLMFPEVVGPLLSKANDRIGGQTQWKSIMDDKYFLNAKLRRNETRSIHKLCDIYAQRAHALWNNEDLLKWVWRHCRFILERLKNPKQFKIDEEVKSDKGDDVEEDELVEMEDLSVFDGIRDSVYGNKQQNKWQMLDVNDFSDVITSLPAEELPDPLMRAQRVDLNDLQHLSGEELNHVLDQLLAAGIEIPPEIQQRLNQGQNLQNQNVFQAMLYSMMPWVNPIINPPDQDMNQPNDDNDAANNNDNE